MYGGFYFFKQKINHLLLNSAQIIAVAIATFRESAVIESEGNGGMKSRWLTYEATVGLIPLPSLPIIIIPL